MKKLTFILTIHFKIIELTIEVIGEKLQNLPWILCQAKAIYL